RHRHRDRRRHHRDDRADGRVRDPEDRHRPGAPHVTPARRRGLTRLIRARARLRRRRDPNTHMEAVMSLVKILPAWFHAVADSSGAVGTGVVVGATVLLVSMLTRYPLGVAKVLPFPVHSGGDYLAAALLLAAPWALNFSSGDGGLTAFYVAAGAAVLLVSLVTNYQYSPKRSWVPVAQAA